MNQQQRLLFTFLLLTTCVVFFTILIYGQVSIPINSLWKILVGSNDVQDLYRDIFWKLRFPKAITALLAGAALSISGLIMQTFFNNPLAGPFVLGIHSGSSLGVALWIMASSAIGSIVPAFAHNFGLVFFAFLGGLIILTVLMFLSLKIPGKVVLLVVGLMFGHLSGGIINILVAVSDAQEIKTFLLWTLGSFQRVSGDQLTIFASVLSLSLFASFFLIKNLNVLLLGDRYAKSLGLSLVRTKLVLILMTALLSGTVTAFCGPVAFVGIVVPHIARSLFRSSDHSILLPVSLLIGSIMTLLAEFFSSCWGEFILPLNAVTGLMGMPIIFFFLWNQRNKESL